MEFRIGWHHGRRGQFRFEHPVWIHPTVYIDNTDDITLSHSVSISRNTEIYTHDHYHDERTLEMDVRDGRIKSSPLYIDNDVWIGANVIILASCNHIGPGAVIGAGSIVTKDIGKCEVWAGNPAKFIRFREKSDTETLIYD